MGKAAVQLPRWTMRVSTDSVGRDPLGLSRVASQLLDGLVPGIVVNTTRARYYSLYPWILWHIQATEAPKTYAQFQSAFQRREAAIGIATVLSESDLHPAGINAIKTALAKQTDPIRTQMRVLPSSSLGGYGQYYGGSLFVLGLTKRDASGIETVAGSFAENLAKEVHTVVEKAPYVAEKHFEESLVARDVLAHSARRLGLDALSKPETKRERHLLIDLFFHWATTEQERTRSDRRDSLAWMLWLLQAYERREIDVADAALDTRILDGPAYFGALLNPDGVRIPLAQEPRFARVAGRWRQFSLHQLLTLALERLLEALLDRLEGAPSGLTLAELAADMASEVPAGMNDLVGSKAPRPQVLFSRLGVNALPTEQVRKAGIRRFSAGATINEVHGLDDQSVAGALLTLSLLYAKWRASDDRDFTEVARASGEELCAPAVLGFLDRWLVGQCSWQTAIEEILRLITSKHDRVMYEKGKLESCWLHFEGDHLMYDQSYIAVRRSSRLWQAANLLGDLGLLDRSDNGMLTLTTEGRVVLERAMKCP